MNDQTWPEKLFLYLAGGYIRSEGKWGGGQTQKLKQKLFGLFTVLV